MIKVTICLSFIVRDNILISKQSLEEDRRIKNNFFVAPGISQNTNIGRNSGPCPQAHELKSMPVFAPACQCPL